VEIVEIGMQVDHIHAIIIIPPKYSVSEIIGRIKGRSASVLRKKFVLLEKVYWNEWVVWSLWHFVSTIGLNEQSMIKYVQWQKSQDSCQAKFEFYGGPTGLPVGFHLLKSTANYLLGTKL